MLFTVVPQPEGKPTHAPGNHVRNTKALALAIHLACTGLAASTVVTLPILLSNPANAQSNVESQARIAFDIPSGSLSAVLNRFAEQTGLYLSGAGGLTNNKTSSGLKGDYTVADGLQQLLAGSGITFRFSGKNTVTLMEGSDGVTRLPPVKISSTTIQDGSAEAGYVSKEVSQVGPWQGRSLQDTPYSMNIVSEDLIKNIGATVSPDQLFKINPTTQFSWPQTQNDYPSIFMRGFQVFSSARNGVNRIRNDFTHGLIMEEVERVEILTGLSGFLYGGGNVGGIVNYVTKRPTDERFNSITFGNTSGQNFYVNGDFGGQFNDEGTFGYRINLTTQDGDTFVDHQSIDRDSISTAFDWEVTDDLLLTLDLAHRDYEIEGRQSYWSVAPGVNRPDADDIDSSKLWGQKWGAQETKSMRGEVSLTWNINDNISFRTRYQKEEKESSDKLITNFIQSDDIYNQRALVISPTKFKGEGGYGFLDFAFSIGQISHKVTTGLQLTKLTTNIHEDRLSNFVFFNNLSLDSPEYMPEPAWSPYGVLPTYNNRKNKNLSFTIGDEITFNDQWSALVGITQAKIMFDSYTANGTKTASYDDKDITPTVSILYQIQPWLTTYVSYIEALEQGGTAADTFEAYTVTNRGGALKPLISEQIEIGAKASVGGMLLTAALFEIDKPLEYYAIRNDTEAEFVQDGKQVHKGLELTATGKITENLSLVGGATFISAEVKNNKQNPTLEDKTPSNVAERFYKAYLEYDLPYMPGLSLSGGISHTGDFYGNSENTDEIDGYTLIDIGARYQVDMANIPLTLRFNVNNLSNERYWANSSFLGDARTISFSANIQF